MNYDWVKETNYEEKFPEEYKAIINEIGLDNFLKLFRLFAKTPIYFSERPIYELKKEYILKHKNKPPRELARILGMSERGVYKILNETGFAPEQMNLFNPPKAEE